MKRIRNLGLAVIAALALTASVGTTSASASAFVPSGAGYPEYPAEIVGEATEYTHLRVGLTSIWFSCEGYPQYLWAIEVTKPIDTLSHAGGKANCETHLPLGKVEKSVLETEAIGCGTIFHAGQEIAPGEFSGTVDIAPGAWVPKGSKCSSIKINGNSCDVLIPEQKGLTGVSLVNQDNGAAADSVIASMDSEVQLSVENCGGVKATFGKYDAEWEPMAYNVAEEPIDLHVDQTGVYTGEAGFEAEGYPVTLLGKGDAGGAQQLNFAGRIVTCTNATFDGELSSATDEIGLKANYDDCTSNVLGNPSLPTTMAMNSCSYVLDASGTLDVVCAKEGDGIVTTIYANLKNQQAGIPGCVYKIGAQSGVGSVSYSTVGEGSERKIDADLNLSGLSYTRTTGSDLLCAKTPNTVTYKGGLTLAGVM
ncbi:MAG TPA: hypothetical protein VNO20_09860 [Solirubrobacterales bacterium]|nr:hypothetical protein [Solirubrobacterales bacterium]